MTCPRWPAVQPGRRTKALEYDGHTEWSYFIAEKLRCTVAELEAKMSNAEFVGWQVYFGRKAQIAQQQMWKGG